MVLNRLATEWLVSQSKNLGKFLTRPLEIRPVIGDGGARCGPGGPISIPEKLMQAGCVKGNR